MYIDNHRVRVTQRFKNGVLNREVCIGKVSPFLILTISCELFAALKRVRPLSTSEESEEDPPEGKAENYDNKVT